MSKSSAATASTAVTVRVLGTLPSALPPPAATSDNPPRRRQGLLLNGRPVCPQCGMAPDQEKAAVLCRLQSDSGGRGNDC